VKGTNADMSVKFDLVRDSRDNRFLATSGSRVESYVQIASTGLGGDYDFVKSEVEAKQYFTVFNIPNWGKHVLSVGVDAGIAAPFNGTSSVPIFDRFFAGGPGDAASLRGFAFRGIGPVQGAHNIQVGGEAMVLTTAEYEFPIVQNTIRGVFFTDAGTVAPDIDHMGDQSFRVAVGSGLRLRFPFFGGIPIALDWGIPLSKQSTDQTQLFSFTIGTGFRF
jgi:outer membrane protein assembly factor BamA